MSSNPIHVHTDCPEINLGGFLTPGRVSEVGPFNRERVCGYHDHLNENDQRFWGSIDVR